MATLQVNDLARLRQETDFNTVNCTVIFRFKAAATPTVTKRLFFLNNNMLCEVLNTGAVRLRDSGNTVFSDITSSTGIVSTGVDVFIAARLSSTTATLFINGYSVGTATITGLRTGDTGFHIGETSNGLVGEYGSVLLYDTNKGDFEIRSIWQSRGRMLFLNGLISRWDFDEIIQGGSVGLNTIKNKVGFTGDVKVDGTGTITGGAGSIYNVNRRRRCA